jgi:hypothetical protein
MTTYVLAVLTKVKNEVLETHTIEEVQVVEQNADMAPVDVWRGARLVCFDLDRGFGGWI